MVAMAFVDSRNYLVLQLYFDLTLYIFVVIVLRRTVLLFLKLHTKSIKHSYDFLKISSKVFFCSVVYAHLTMYFRTSYNIL